MSLSVLLIAFGALRAPLRGVAPMTRGYAAHMAVSLPFGGGQGSTGPSEEVQAKYRLLGLAEDANYDEINRAYDDLASKYKGDTKMTIKLQYGHLGSQWNLGGVGMQCAWDRLSLGRFVLWRVWDDRPLGIICMGRPSRSVPPEVGRPSRAIARHQWRPRRPRPHPPTWPPAFSIWSSLALA
jgi:hypothetical protein